VSPESAVILVPLDEEERVRLRRMTVDHVQDGARLVDEDGLRCRRGVSEERLLLLRSDRQRPDNRDGLRCSVSADGDSVTAATEER
jgi:hypothetical protein